MRIVYHHRTRGTDAQIIHVLEIVRSLRELGHHVELVSLFRPKTKQDDAQANAKEASWKRVTRRLPFSYEIVQIGYNLVGLPLLIYKLLTTKADCLYERYALFNFSGVLAARLLRLPVILEVNSPFAIEQSRDADIRMVRFAIWSERIICNWASKVVAVSGVLRDILAKEMRVSPDRIQVLLNGVNLDRFRNQEPDSGLRESLGLKGKTVIGFVGWFRNWHGLSSLLESFHEENFASRGAALLMVGDGPARRALDDYIRRNEVPGVVFTGPVPNERVPALLGLIDIAVQPAANEYCCPMKILEYMALGKAVIAPDQTNIRELLQHERNGLLFEPNSRSGMTNAIRSLLEDAERRRMLGKRASQTIVDRNLSWEHNAEAVLALIRASRDVS